MKFFILALTAAGFVAAASSSSYAESSKPRIGLSGFEQPSRLGRKNRSPQVRGFARRRDAGRMRIGVTRQTSTSRFIYRDFPLWAAQAFEPKGGGR